MIWAIIFGVAFILSVIAIVCLVIGYWKMIIELGGKDDN